MASKKSSRAPRTETRPFSTGLLPLAAITVNLLILGIAAYAGALDTRLPDLYYESVQEDQALEWASFWAFALASAVFVIAAARQRKSTGRLPWFLLGLALFCFFVAMEEISWGQRIAGFRPPDYFLAENFQQELNLHNVVDTDYRKLALKGVILGYGVILPLLGLLPVLRRAFHRLAVVTPPWQLVPAFLATYLVYESYPWRFSGEWVELMLGLGFLFTAVVHAWQYGPGLPARSARQAGALALIWLIAMVLGASTAAVSKLAYQANPEVTAAAAVEVEALKADFLSGRVSSRCDLHKRLYSFMEKYEQSYLLEGEFSRLTTRGLPEPRAEFLLDPWNSPYWLRDRCSDDRRVTFIYSFGPNRKRDSSRGEILGDDIGTIIQDEGR